MEKAVQNQELLRFYFSKFGQLDVREVCSQSPSTLHFRGILPLTLGLKQTWCCSVEEEIGADLKNCNLLFH